MINDYEVIYLISNAVTTYSIFLFFKIFFDERVTNLNIEICSYIVMYVATSILFVMDFTPKIIIIANIILLLKISRNYKSGIVQKNNIISINIYDILGSRNGGSIVNLKYRTIRTQQYKL